MFSEPSSGHRQTVYMVQAAKELGGLPAEQQQQGIQLGNVKNDAQNSLQALAE